MIAPLLVLAALIAGWELVAQEVDPLLLPAPSAVATALWEDRSILAPDLAVTTQEVVFGLLAGLLVGVGLAVAMHLVPAVEKTLRPLVVGSQAVPIPVLAPLVVFALGFGLAPKIVVVALICFFPVVVNVMDGLRDVDPDARRMLGALGSSRWQRLRFLEAPSALPNAFTGLKIAAAAAVIGAVLAETAGSTAGLGHLVVIANGQLESARVFAATVLLIAEAVGLYALFSALERRVVSWSPRTDS